MRYIIFHKPFGVLSQFTPNQAGQLTLADGFELPTGVYPAGRLDRDSEGMLLLTDDGALNHHLTHPRHAHPRTYWAQVEHRVTPEAIESLRRGVVIRIRKKAHQTLPARVHRLEPAPQIPPRDPPIRERKNIPTDWLEITLSEGKNRQVRRMGAAVGHPVLRLIRVAIGDLPLGDLAAGAWRELDRQTAYVLLRGGSEVG